MTKEIRIKAIVAVAALLVMLSTPISCTYFILKSPDAPMRDAIYFSGCSVVIIAVSALIWAIPKLKSFIDRNE